MKNQATKFLLNQLRPYRKTIAWLSVAAVVAAVLNTIVPIMYGRALDVVIQRRPLTFLAAYLGAWLAFRFAADALGRMLTFTGQSVGQRTAMNFVRGAHSHLLALDVSSHYAHRAGDLQERIGNVRESIRAVLRQGVFELIPNLLTVIAIAGYLFTVDVLLGTANLVVIVVLLWQSWSYVELFDATWNRVHEISRKYYGRAWDAIKNILIVKSSGAEAHERVVGEQLSSDALREYIATEVVARRHSATHSATYNIGTVIVFAIAALGITAGRLTPGQLVTVFGYSFMTWGMVRGAVWSYWTFTELRVAVQQYEEIAQLATESYGVGRPLEIRGGVEFKDVRFRYRDDTPVLEDVSFHVAAGQTVALVGESGEGKTTIVELLSRYHQPQNGTITVDGVPVTEIELGNLRSQIAYVPQDLSLFHDTIRENIRYGKLDATNADVEDAARKAALHDWIATLAEGYETKVGERGLKLSAGQRQRIAIARAFLRNPKILILDEPTSNLDAFTEAQIHQSLRELMVGRTTFVVAHRLRTVQEADRIFVLQDGRIIEQGTHDELMAKSDVYRKMRDMQFGDALDAAA